MFVYKKQKEELDSLKIKVTEVVPACDDDDDGGGTGKEEGAMEMSKESKMEKVEDTNPNPDVNEEGNEAKNMEVDDVKQEAEMSMGMEKREEKNGLDVDVDVDVGVGGESIEFGSKVNLSRILDNHSPEKSTH